jgi:hypothetical protein
MNPIDMTGRPISVGARVAFATLSYKSAHLRVGQVVEIRATKTFDVFDVRVFNETAGRREWRRDDQVVLLSDTPPVFEGCPDYRMNEGMET